MNPYAPPRATVSDPPQDDRPRVWATKLLAAFFAFFSLYSGSSLLYQRSLLVIAVGCLCGVAALGLWRERPWSRWVVYLISTLICVYFAWYVSALLQGGWPYDSTTRSVVSLIPGALLLMFGAAAAVHVARLFRKH